MIRATPPIGRHQSARAQAVYWRAQGTVLGHRPIVKQCAHVDRGWETISVREGEEPGSQALRCQSLLWLHWGRAFQLREAGVQVSEFLLERELGSAAGMVFKITFAARAMKGFLENEAQQSHFRMTALEL